jgi:hypothetical protein
VKFPDGTTADGGPTNNWSPIEIQNLKNQGSFTNTVQRGQDAARVANIQGTDVLTDSEGNTYVRTRTGTTPTAGSPPQPVGPLTKPGTTPVAKTMSPSDVEKERAVIASGIVASHPELAPYITVTGNTVTVKKPSRGLFTGVSGELQQNYDAAVKAIFGAGNPLTTGTNVQIGGPRPVPQKAGGAPIIQHSPSTGQYRISHDGGKTWQPYTPSGGE